MASNAHGSAPWLALIVGGLVIVVAIVAFMALRGPDLTPSAPSRVTIDLNVPKAPSIPDAPKLPTLPTPKPQ